MRCLGQVVKCYCIFASISSIYAIFCTHSCTRAKPYQLKMIGAVFLVGLLLIWGLYIWNYSFNNTLVTEQCTHLKLALHKNKWSWKMLICCVQKTQLKLCFITNLNIFYNFRKNEQSKVFFTKNLGWNISVASNTIATSETHFQKCQKYLNILGYNTHIE